MIYSINYDLNRPGQNYKDLYDGIKSLGDWWHYLDSSWLVDTDLGADAIWDRLKPHVDKNDNLLIIGVTEDYSGWLQQEAWNWLKDRSQKLPA